MIIPVKQSDLKNVTVSVITKNSGVYWERNITEKPFGDNETLISFWEDEDTILIFPMSEVISITMHLNGE